MILTSFHRHFRFVPNSTQGSPTLGERKVCFFFPRGAWRGSAAGGWCLLMAPAAVPPRKCSLRSFIDNRLVLLLYDALEKWQNDGATEGAFFVHTFNIRWGTRLSLTRSSTDCCHLAPDASARCAVNKIMITISTNRSGGYCWSVRNSPECLQFSQLKQ